MSFTFDKDVFFSGEIETLMKDKLNNLLSSNNTKKPNKNSVLGNSYGKIAASDNNVFVKKISFNNKPPIIDILGMSILDSTISKSSSDNKKEFISNSTNDQTNDNKTIKTIVKLVIENFKIELKSDIESNLLLVYGGKNIDPFLFPDFVSNESFNIPINLKFSNCKLETILDLNYQIGSNVNMNFNDVNISFEFDCSIPLLSSNIKKRLTSNIDFIFKEVLPNAILDMSMKYMSKKNSSDANDISALIDSKHMESVDSIGSINNDSSINNSMNNDITLKQQLMLSFGDGEGETASPVTMMKLSAMASKRFSLSLRNFEEDDSVLERSNLTKILSKKTLTLSKLAGSYTGVQQSIGDSNIIYETTKAMNVLPMPNTLKFDQQLIEQIADLQETLYESSLKRHGKTKKFKRRKIALNKSKKAQTPEKEENKEKETNISPITSEHGSDDTLVEPMMPAMVATPVKESKTIWNEQEKKMHKEIIDVDKTPDIKNMRIETQLINKPVLKHNNSLILTPTPMSKNLSSPSTPGGILMKRAMTPLLFNENSRSPSIGLPEHIEPAIKLNWKNNDNIMNNTNVSAENKQENSEKDVNGDGKINITLKKNDSENNVFKNTSTNHSYMKFLEKTPLKNWIQAPSYLENFAQIHNNTADAYKVKTRSNDNNINDIHNNVNKDINNMLQELHIAPPPYSNN
ncbi:hypothetical protein ACO0SA_001875 [Hanseniaspora valbyensis]